VPDSSSPQAKQPFRVVAAVDDSLAQQGVPGWVRKAVCFRLRKQPAGDDLGSDIRAVQDWAKSVAEQRSPSAAPETARFLALFEFDADAAAEAGRAAI